ncbi:MAG: hypothetical protein AABY22_15270 [Nanoarchaeota archaeon]
MFQLDSNFIYLFPLDYPQTSGVLISKKNIYSDGKISLTKALKKVSFKCSDRDKNYLTKNKANIKSATLSKTKSGDYYLSIMIDGSIDKVLPAPKNQIIGIDLGINTFIVDSNGITFQNIKSTRNSQ